MGDRLSTVLIANGVFSGVSGGVLAAGSFRLDATLGLETWLLAVVGGLLVGYGGLLFLLARRDDARPGVRFATTMDIGWVIGAAVILIGLPAALTAPGRVALLLVSGVVAGFAAVQSQLLRVPGLTHQ